MHSTAPDQGDLESQLGILLRSGRAAGFSIERFDLCLRLIAQIPSPASQKAWFSSMTNGRSLPRLLSACAIP